MTFAPARFEIATSNKLREKCIYKKVHYLTFGLDLGVKATQMLLSILYIKLAIHLPGLRLLRPAVKEMHLQENTFLTFDLDLCCQGHS